MKKKICIVFNHFQFQDGVARAAIATANTLVEREDVEVTLIPIFKFHENALGLVDKRVKIKPFFRFYFRGMQKLVDLISPKMLYSLVIKEKYDVEIGFCRKTPIQMIGSSKNSDAKHFVWMHEYDPGLKLKKYYESADKLICVSRESSERVASESGGSINVDFAYNPIDDIAIIEQGKADVEIPKTGEPVFVSVGRLSPEKGFDRIINAVKRLKDDGYKLKFWLVGDGDEYGKLVEQTKALGLEEEIVFWGTQKNPHAYTSKADVFICSSYREGYSTACTEAVILGVPVITTLVGGAREIIEDSQAGLLVANTDDALYEGIKYALDNPDKVLEWKSVLKTSRVRFSHAERKKKLFDLLGLTSRVEK